MKQMDTAGVRLHMRFEKPFPSAQGMAIWGDWAFQLFHTGQCTVFDLKSGDPKPLAIFPLGSANTGVPTKDYTNHSNQCMFSDVHVNGNPLPLLYVTAGCGIGADEDGYFYRCAVEDIRLQFDADGHITGGSAECLQTISYKDGPMEGLPYTKPCWGCPAWFVDNRQKAIYMFSARYRTTPAYKDYYAVNEYIITRFPLPDPLSGGFIRFGPADIQDQFTAPFDIPFTQGGMIAGNKLFYTFGCGDEERPDGIRIFDLDKKCLIAKANLDKSAMSSEELESCSFWGKELIGNTNAKPMGGFYRLGTAYYDLLET